MSFLSEDHPNARFCVTAYKTEEADENETDDSTSYYSSFNEAEQAYRKLIAGGQYYSLYLADWIGDDIGWRDRGSWCRDDLRA